jgi:hypothetical protein
VKRFFYIGVVCFFLAQPLLATFLLTVSDSLVDFGNVSLGESKYGIPVNNLKLTCRSDQGNPWQIQIHGNGDLDSGVWTFPLKNLKWFGTYASSIDSGAANASQRFFQRSATSLGLTDQTVYRSDTTGDNALTGGSAVYLQFGITIPDTQPQGTYGTTVFLTMTE